MIEVLHLTILTLFLRNLVQKLLKLCKIILSNQYKDYFSVASALKIQNLKLRPQEITKRFALNICKNTYVTRSKDIYIEPKFRTLRVGTSPILHYSPYHSDARTKLINQYHDVLFIITHETMSEQS